MILTLPETQADHETRSRKRFCVLDSQQHSRLASANAGSLRPRAKHCMKSGLIRKKQLFNGRVVYLERTALIFNHVRPCVSSRKDTNRKETLASPAPLPGGEQPCFTAETKPRNVSYLETLVGLSGLISATADSLRSGFEIAGGRKKGWGTPELQGSVDDLNICPYTFLLS